MQKYSLMNKNEKLDMGREQRKDQNLYQIMGCICNRKIPDTKYANGEIRALAKQINNLFITQDGVLLRKFHKHNGRDYDTQIVAPKHLREEILYRLHHPKTEGHRGSRKTIQECRNRFYWPNYQEDIEAYIANCLTCIQLKSTPEQNIRPPLRGITHENSFPGDMMQIDLIGPFKPSAGFTQVLTAIDVFTKYLFAVPLRRVTARATTDALTTIFLRHAYVPKILLTDKGSQLTSNLVKEMTTLFDIELRHATTKHAQTIGLLERTHASIKKVLKIYENRMHSDWHKYLDYAVFAHNTSRNPKTRTTPADLFHGFTPHKAIDARFDIPQKNRPEFETTQQLQDRLRHLFSLQKQDILETYLKNKKYYDKKANAKPLALHSFCLLLNPRLDTQKQKMDKMEPKWLALYRVEKIFPRDNYLIREVQTHHTQIVHRIRLRPYMPQGTIADLPKVDPEKFIPDPRFTEEDKEPALMDYVREHIFHDPEDAQINAPTEEQSPMKAKTRTITYSNMPGVGYQRIKAPQMPSQTKEALKIIRQAVGNQIPLMTPLLTAQKEKKRRQVPKLDLPQLPSSRPHTRGMTNNAMKKPPPTTHRAPTSRERLRANEIPTYQTRKQTNPLQPTMELAKTSLPIKKAAKTIGRVLKGKLMPKPSKPKPVSTMKLRMPRKFTNLVTMLYPDEMPYADETVSGGVSKSTPTTEDGGAEFDPLTPYENDTPKAEYDSDAEIPFDEEAMNDREDIHALIRGGNYIRAAPQTAPDENKPTPNEKSSPNTTSSPNERSSCTTEPPGESDLTNTENPPNKDSTPNKTNSPNTNGSPNTLQPQPIPRASNTLHFHTGQLPTPKQTATDETADCADIYTNFVPREKILSMLNKKTARKMNTPHGTPQIGDVRRYYDKTRRQYVTSLILAAKGKPTTVEALELALENLKVQAETLNAKNIHISLQQRILKPLTQLDMLYAIEKTFADTPLTVHIWTAQ